jgi:CubicO group peptidase (beta-lactamase class C family)
MMSIVASTASIPARGLLTEARVWTPDPPAVVRVGPEERSDLPLSLVWDQAVRLYASGLHPAIGLCIRHRGRVVLDRTIGHVENPPGGDPGAIVTPETPFNLFSASKILTALVVMALVEDGVIALEERAAAYLPELGTHRKDRITIRHLLNHTAGIPDMPEGLDLPGMLEAGRVDLGPLYDLRPVAPPGRSVAYHPMTSWLLLEEIVRRTTGSDLRTLARRRILDPLGFRRMCYGVTPDEVPLVAKHAQTGLPSPAPMSRIFARTIGTDLDTAIPLTNRPSFLTAILPSANVIATGAEVCRFLQLLLDGGKLDGVRVLDERTVRRMYTELTPMRFDGTFGLPMRYGLGVMMGGPHVSLYGPRTEEAFGHLGFTTVVVYADPARDLCVSFLNTGKPMFAPGMVRWAWILQRLAMMVPRR